MKGKPVLQLVITWAFHPQHIALTSTYSLTCFKFVISLVIQEKKGITLRNCQCAYCLIIQVHLDMYTYLSVNATSLIRANSLGPQRCLNGVRSRLPRVLIVYPIYTATRPGLRFTMYRFVINTYNSNQKLGNAPQRLHFKSAPLPQKLSCFASPLGPSGTLT